MTDTGDEPPDPDERDNEWDHPVPTEEVTPEDRARALQSLLVEKELLSTDAVDEVVQAYEKEIGPMNGAEVVARAWDDPEYREWLLEDGTAAIADMGYTGVQGVDVEVKENTPDVHNAIVCTLCSCYPWPVLGLPPTWYKSPPYRSKVVKRPRETLREEFGVPLADDTEVRVWDSSSEVRYMVLPQRPDGTEGLDRAALAEVVTRDAMIGVERLPEGYTPAAADGGRAESAGSASSTDPLALDRPESVERTVDAVRESTDLPQDNGDVVFEAPWQARAFAMVVRLRHDDRFQWAAFQERLVDAVRSAGGTEQSADGTDATRSGTETAYYEQWLAAFERLVVEKGLLDADHLAARAGAFAAGERDAAEFVHGDGADHGHAHAASTDHGQHSSDHGHTHHADHEHADSDHGHDHADHAGRGRTLDSDSSTVADEPVARDPGTTDAN